ncbi:MAG: hypothetical protein GY930_13960 [bacterium]|nr:hypothetical protein [bacterium]
MIQLIGPGGAGKTSTGALVAERLGIPFLDLDTVFLGRNGDIGAFIDRQDYGAYAHENVSTYLHVLCEHDGRGVFALSSGFMIYPKDVHPEYFRIRTEIEQSPTTFVLLPSLELEVCVPEIVRRQNERAFGRSPAREEAVIRARFSRYLSNPARKVQTMRPIDEVAGEIVGALQLGQKAIRSQSRIRR